MPNESYIRNAASAIQNDLKIFLGKEEEIHAIESMKRTVAGKWYLAWDKGKIFVANPSGALVQYGGSREQLSEDDIKTLVENCTKDDFSYIKKQIAIITEQYREFQEKSELLNNLEAAIATKVNEYIDSNNEFSYSKLTIDSKLTELKNTCIQDAAGKYLTLAQANALYNPIDTRQLILYADGDTISAYANVSKAGLYYCVKDSLDGSFIKGRVYYITTTCEDIENPVSYKLYIRLGTTDSCNLKFGDSFNGTKLFTLSYNGITASDISGNLSLYAPDGSCVKADIDPSITNFVINAELENLDVGSYKYIIKGKTIDNENIEGYYIVNVAEPVFYGYTNETMTSEIMLTLNTKFAFSSIYNYQLTDTMACYICIPATKNISEFYIDKTLTDCGSGNTLALTNNGITKQYKYYVTALTTGEHNITII